MIFISILFFFSAFAIRFAPLAETKKLIFDVMNNQTKSPNKRKRESSPEIEGSNDVVLRSPNKMQIPPSRSPKKKLFSQYEEQESTPSLIAIGSPKFSPNKNNGQNLIFGGKNNSPPITIGTLPALPHSKTRKWLTKKRRKRTEVKKKGRKMSFRRSHDDRDQRG